ncbi:hypothetical protein [Ulvibacter antarcticus]|uniref:Uncharacterized protein n=1 Tax=Ulvibacter antarcticus TaxID=442714 RepID=A0A3L9YDY4_9FLAO|nr:hypothetical protein [Ulvibacter antarcticus]RMA57259.1 hypothetical protein BXY75_3146 [Ulvibacter antarcticus]
MRIVSFILFVGLLHSCCTTKEKMTNDFTSGTIVHSTDENDCAYTIKVSNTENVLYLDPINLENMYMKDGLKVQFQYKSLKMKNRCNKANPISLTKMTKE